jgi:hypothetical protein
VRLTRRQGVVLATAALLGGAAATAGAVSTTCNVAASGGYANCLNASNPGWEQAKAPSGSATPYRFQLHRFSDGANWGYWEWNDLNYHTVFLSIAGVVTAQVDNRGSGTAGYYVAMG